MADELPPKQPALPKPPAGLQEKLVAPRTPFFSSRWRIGKPAAQEQGAEVQNETAPPQELPQDAGQEQAAPVETLERIKKRLGNEYYGGHRFNFIKEIPEGDKGPRSEMDDLDRMPNNDERNKTRKADDVVPYLRQGRKFGIDVKKWREEKDKEHPPRTPIAADEMSQGSVQQVGGDKERPAGPMKLPLDEAATPLLTPAQTRLHDAIKSAADKAQAALHDSHIYEDVSEGRPIYRVNITEYHYSANRDAYYPTAYITSELIKHEVLDAAKESFKGNPEAIAKIDALKKMEMDEVKKDPVVGKIFSQLDDDYDRIIRKHREEEAKTPKPRARITDVVPAKPVGEPEEFLPEMPAIVVPVRPSGPITSLPGKNNIMPVALGNSAGPDHKEAAQEATKNARLEAAKLRLDTAAANALASVMEEMKGGSIRTGKHEGRPALLMGTGIYVTGEQHNKYEKVAAPIEYKRFKDKLRDSVMTQLDHDKSPVARDAREIFEKNQEQLLGFELKNLQNAYNSSIGAAPLVAPEKPIRVPELRQIKPPPKEGEKPARQPVADTEELADKKVQPAGKDEDAHAPKNVELMPYEVQQGLPNKQPGPRKR